MIINLVPEFLAVLASSARDTAYERYLERHRQVLDAYWHNDVLDQLVQDLAQLAIGAALAAGGAHALAARPADCFTASANSAAPARAAAATPRAVTRGSAIRAPR